MPDLRRTAIFAASLLFVSAALAQINRATVVGRVTDPTGLPVSGARVDVVRVLANERFSAETTSSGDYTVGNLPADLYEIRIAVTGFRSEVRSGIRLETGSTSRFDITLQIGSVAESVRIEAVAPVLRTENPELGQVVTNKMLLGLPNSSRDFASLTNLAAGVAPRRGTLGDDTQTNGFNVQGARWSDNLLYVDGTMVVDGNGTPTFYPNLDALEEVEVKTGLYSAEFGVKPGGQISTVTKSGTNSYHGSAFLFRQDENFGARRFFDRTERPEYKRNQFGAVLSGPVLLPKLFNGKDRMWFLVSYQGYRTREFRNLNANVPTAAEKTGQFAQTITDPANGNAPFPGNRIPANRISPVAQKFLPFWPDPNASAAGYNFVSGNSTAISDNNQIMAKIDFSQNPNNRWSGRMVYDDSPLYNPNVFQTFAYQQPLRSWAPNIANTRTFKGRYVNDLSVHLFRRPYILSPGNSSDRASFGRDLGIPNWPTAFADLEGMPGLGISGPYARLGDAGTIGAVTIGNWEIKENFSFVWRNHSLKAGFHFRQNFNNFVLNSRSTLTFDRQFSGNGFADFLLGYVGTATLGAESVRGNFHQNGTYYYIQDDWKVSSKLTVNLGLRYEYRFPWRDKRGFMTNPNPITGAFQPPLQDLQLKTWETGRFTPDVPLVEWSKNGWMPRIGVAYRATPKTVIRSGFGVFGNEPVVGVIQNLGSNPRPNAAARNFQSDFTTPNLPLSDPFNTGAQRPNTALLNYRGVEQRLPQTLSFQWGLTVQRALDANTVVEAAYSGRQGSHEFMLIEWNDALPGTGDRQLRRPFRDLNSFLMMYANGHSNYHGIEVKVNHRPSVSGLVLIAAFTYGKGIDTGGGRLGVPGDPSSISRNIPLSVNRGLSEGNIPGRLSIGATYELPFGKGKRYANQGLASAVLGGWFLQNQLQIQAGPYINASLGTNSVDSGSAASQWPDRLHDPNLPKDQRTVERWFDTTALAIPAAQTYGNAGRSIIQAPGLANWDAGINRLFTLREQVRLEFRFEGFNMANHANFGLPNVQVNPTNTAYGTINSTLRPRDLQLGLKLTF